MVNWLPLAGCGVMMVLCMVVMSGSHRRSRQESPSESVEVTALRSELAELRKAVHPASETHPQ